MNEDSLAQKIKEYRVVSVSCLTFLGYEMHQLLQWVMTSSPESLGEGVAITGIMASLAAMFKFVFEFATFNSSK